METSRYYIHFLLSPYGQALIDLFNDKLLTADEVIEEANIDLLNGDIDEVEWNVVINHIENFNLNHKNNES